jgi:hypothetical protein
MTRDELRGSVEDVRAPVDAPPTTAVCPCCGARSIPRGLVLPPIKRRIFDAVQRRPGIGAEALRDRIWAADPNGGPEDRKVLHVHVHQLNRLLRPHGIRVRGSASGGYRVVNILDEGAP